MSPRVFSVDLALLRQLPKGTGSPAPANCFPWMPLPRRCLPSRRPCLFPTGSNQVGKWIPRGQGHGRPLPTAVPAGVWLHLRATCPHTFPETGANADLSKRGLGAHFLSLYFPFSETDLLSGGSGTERPCCCQTMGLLPSPS